MILCSLKFNTTLISTHKEVTQHKSSLWPVFVPKYSAAPSRVNETGLFTNHHRVKLHKFVPPIQAHGFPGAYQPCSDQNLHPLPSGTHLGIPLRHVYVQICFCKPFVILRPLAFAHKSVALAGCSLGVFCHQPGAGGVRSKVH